jgi:hypothetical protein
MSAVATLTLIALLNNAPAMHPVQWSIDGNNIQGKRHSLTHEVNYGKHNVCASYEAVTRCREANVIGDVEVRISVDKDYSFTNK